MKRLQEQDKPKKEKKEVPPPIQRQPIAPTRPIPPVATRQISEDEIDRLKRQNKGKLCGLLRPSWCFIQSILSFHP